MPVAGLPNYLAPPLTPADVLLDPFHTLLYVVFFTSLCGVFAKIWIEVAGSSPAGVAKDLREQQLVIRGHRDTALEHELNR